MQVLREASGIGVVVVTYVALLRGVNVGGNRKVDMKQLKATFERAGMEEVRTYINSGNVIFRSESADQRKLVVRLEGAIESAFGFPVKVVVRDAKRFRELIDALPDTWVNGAEFRCDVMFLSDAVDAPDVLALLPVRPEIDEVAYVAGAILWRVSRSAATRSGMLRLIGTELYANMTIRNCTTVRKLDALMR
jgi:uncharacterized protein (DUF1697 family)